MDVLLSFAVFRFPSRQNADKKRSEAKKALPSIQNIPPHSKARSNGPRAEASARGGPPVGVLRSLRPASFLSGFAIPLIKTVGSEEDDLNCDRGLSA